MFHRLKFGRNWYGFLVIIFTQIFVEICLWCTFRYLRRINSNNMLLALTQMCMLSVSVSVWMYRGDALHKTCAESLKLILALFWSRETLWILFVHISLVSSFVVRFFSIFSAFFSPLFWSCMHLCSFSPVYPYHKCVCDFSRSTVHRSKYMARIQLYHLYQL